MVVTVVPKNYAPINACEVADDWTGETPADVTDFFKEGSQCVGFTVRGAGDNDIYITGTWDLSGSKHLRWWMMTVALTQLNYVQLYVGDGTNTGYYNVISGSDYPGGWYNAVVDLSRAVDSGTKPTMTSITTIGLRFNHTGVAKNAQNTWIDNVIYCDGLIAYGDLAGSPFGLQEIFDADDSITNGWGIIRKIGGVYYIVGSLTLGDDAGSNICDFQETNEVLIFEERIYGASINVASTLYEIACVAGTGITDILFGDMSGGKGISGCTIKAIDADRPFKFTATDIDIDSFGLYATVFDVHGIVDLALYNVNYEVLGCSFVNGAAQIQPNTMIFKDNFIISNTSPDGAVLFESTSHYISYNNYINNSRATEFPTAETYDVVGDQFTGNTYDIHFSALTGDLVINCGGSPKANPSSEKVLNDSSGIVTINNTVNVTIYVKDTSDVNITDARVFLKAGSGGDYPYQESVSIVRSGAVATVTHGSHGLQTDEYVTIMGANEQEYNGVYQITVIGVDTYTYVISGTPSSPATGTITSTFVILFDLTVDGEVTAVMRYISVDQPFTGRVRRSSSTPLYKQGIVSGTVQNADFSTTVYLVDDE